MSKITKMEPLLFDVIESAWENQQYASVDISGMALALEAAFSILDLEVTQEEIIVKYIAYSGYDPDEKAAINVIDPSDLLRMFYLGEGYDSELVNLQISYIEDTWLTMKDLDQKKYIEAVTIISKLGKIDAITLIEWAWAKQQREIVDIARICEAVNNTFSVLRLTASQEARIVNYIAYPSYSGDENLGNDDEKRVIDTISPLSLLRLFTFKDCYKYSDYLVDKSTIAQCHSIHEQYVRVVMIIGELIKINQMTVEEQGPRLKRTKPE